MIRIPQHPAAGHQRGESSWLGKHPRLKKCRSAWKSTCTPAPSRSDLPPFARWRPAQGVAMLSVLVLGAAAGGGLPQWNCNCGPCSAAWADPALRDTQASIAISADDGAHWFLINASPDIRQQIVQTPALHPRALRHNPIAGVILTNGEVDAVTGLLSLREGSPFAIHAHERVLSVLEENSIFNVLDRGRVPRLPMALETPFEPRLPNGAPS